MSDRRTFRCILLPCSETESWAVPEQCLGEIVTLSAATEQPPSEICWRGEIVPVKDFGRDDSQPWVKRCGGAGLIAVLLGLRGAGCRYWGVALRGAGLGLGIVEEDEVEDLPDAVVEHSSAAFRRHGVVYQIPDLAALQQAFSAGGVANL